MYARKVFGKHFRLKKPRQSMNKFSATRLAIAAVIAALYVILTLLPPFSAISFGPIQFRIAEALCILVLFYGEAVFGVTIGCFIANVFGNGILDMFLGTAATFLATSLSYLVAKHIKNYKLKFVVASIFPIVINAFIVPFTILPFTQEYGYFALLLQIFIGQTAVIYTVGALIYYVMIKHVIHKKHIE